MNIANQGFPATRADLNNALQALASNNSGTSAPSTTFANQWWYDTNNNKLYIRNEANNAWIQVAVLDQTNNEWQITTGVIQAKDSDGLALKTDDGTTRLFIKDSDGSIGIGTSSPSALLNTSFSQSAAYSTTGEPREDVIIHNINGGDGTGVNNHATLGFHVANGATSQGFMNYVRTADNTGVFTFSHRTGGSSYAEHLRIQSGGGISFNGDTAAANALDDYEEGTFTPMLRDATAGNAAGVAASSGRYTKIGRIVNFSFAMSLNSLSGMTGTNGISISGLPYTVNTDSAGGGEPHAQILSFISPLSSGDYSGSIIVRPNNNTTAVELKYTQSGSQTSQGATSLLVNNIGSTAYLCGSATYETT